MTSTMLGYVDAPPIQPPAMGLIASAHLVITGSREDLAETVNPPAAEVESDTTTEAKIPYPENDPTPGDYEKPRIGAPVRWVSGFAYHPEGCNGGSRMNRDATGINTATALEAEVDVRPYLVEGSDVRPTFGVPQADDYAEAQAFAQRQLLSCESKQIEAELWTGKLSDGSLSTNKYITDSHTDLVEGDRLIGYLTALASLEKAINDGTCGQQGMIHCTAETATMWVSEHLCHRVGNLLLTELGTIVVVGSGYTGSAPAAGTVGLDPNHAGQIPVTDSAWAYATTVVDVRRGAFVDPQHVLERAEFRGTHQTLTTWARRPAASTWGCLQAGIHVDHLNRITTTGS